MISRFEHLPGRRLLVVMADGRALTVTEDVDSELDRISREIPSGAATNYVRVGTPSDTDTDTKRNKK